MTAAAYDSLQLQLLINREKKAEIEAEAVYRFLYKSERLAERPFLNMGAGEFNHRYWRTSDRLYGEDRRRWLDIERVESTKDLPAIDHIFDYSAGEALDIPSNSMEVVYSSHSFEHAFDEDVLFAMRECWRVLAPGGVFRVVVPDAQMAFDACRRGDRTFFGFLEKTWPLAYFVASHVSLVFSVEYDGPLSRADVVKIIDNYSFEEAMAVLYDASKYVFGRTGDTRGKHVNWWNEVKLVKMLNQAGFDQVYKSAYGKSLSPILRDTRHFDSTRPTRSVFVEAIKS